MAKSSARNIRDEAVTLPAPYNIILAPGESATLPDTATAVLAKLRGRDLGEVLDVHDVTDADPVDFTEVPQGASIFVVRTGATRNGSVYSTSVADITQMEADIAASVGPKVVVFDGVGGTVNFPAKGSGARWQMQNTTFFLTNSAVVNWVDGCLFQDLKGIGASGECTLNNLNGTSAALATTVDAAGQVMLELSGSASYGGSGLQIFNNTVAPNFPPLIDVSGLIANQFLNLRMSGGSLRGSRTAIALGTTNLGGLILTLGDGARVHTNMFSGGGAAHVALVLMIGSGAMLGRSDLYTGRLEHGSSNAFDGITPWHRMKMFPKQAAGQVAGTDSTVAYTSTTNTGTGNNWNCYQALNATAGNITQPLPLVRLATAAIGSLPSNVNGAMDSTGILVGYVESSGLNRLLLTPQAGETVLGGAGPFVVPPGGAAILISDGVSNSRPFAMSKHNRFTSAEQTATGAPQNVAHPLAEAPTDVVVAVTAGHDGAGGAGTQFPVVSYGAHTTTNFVVTVTAGAKFIVHGNGY